MSCTHYKFLPGTWFLGLSLVLATILNAQETGSISGTVLAEDGTPVDDALVTLVDLRRQSSVDTKGAFRFDGLPPGAYLIQVESDRYGSLVERYEVKAGQTTQIEIDMGRHHHSDAIVVTGSADPRSQLELANPVTILSGESLALRIQPTLGDTLSQEAGINQTWFTAGASRPIIRGLGSDRVRMLQGGLSTGDVSSTSPDHAVGVDPGAAQRIEVLRGPSTLLYGSTAIGGVVNVIDNTIPDLQPTEKITGQFDFGAGTVADELSGRVDLNGGAGKWAWRRGRARGRRCPHRPRTSQVRLQRRDYSTFQYLSRLQGPSRCRRLQTPRARRLGSRNRVSQRHCRRSLRARPETKRTLVGSDGASDPQRRSRGHRRGGLSATIGNHNLGTICL